MARFSFILLILSVWAIPAIAAPKTLIVGSFTGTIASVNLQLDLHDGTGVHTYPTGPISLGLDPATIGTVTTTKGQHTLSFGYTVSCPLFDTVFGTNHLDTGTYYEVSQSTQNPLVFSGGGTTLTGVASLTINNNWNCTVTNASSSAASATATIIAGTATWNTSNLQLTFPAATTGVSVDQVFSNLTAGGSAVFSDAPPTVVIPMLAFSATIPSVNLQLDTHTGAGLQTYSTGPISLGLDPKAGGTLISGGGQHTISFGYTVSCPLFTTLFGSGFTDSGTYSETSHSSGNPFVFSGGGTTQRGVASITINNNWNCKVTNSAMVAGNATWATTNLQLTFPATTTGAKSDQVFGNLVVSNGTAVFGSAPPSVLAISSFTGTIPQLTVQLDLHDGHGLQACAVGPITLGLDQNAIGTVKSGGGLQTISFGYTVTIPVSNSFVSTQLLDSGNYLETSTSTANPFVFSGGGSTHVGVTSITITNYWEATAKNSAMAAGPATWNTTGLQLTFPAAMTGAASDQVFSNLTSSGTATFVPEPAPTELVFSSFSGTIPSINVQLDLHDGSGARTLSTGPLTLGLDSNVGGLVSSGNGLQTLSFGYTVSCPLFNAIYGTGYVDHGLYIETSQSTGNPFVFTGAGIARDGVGTITINNNWNSTVSSKAIAAGPATWNTTNLQLTFPASTTGASSDQVFNNLVVTNGSAAFVVAPRPFAVLFSHAGNQFNVTYSNLDPSRNYTWVRGSAPNSFPTQVGSAFTGTATASLSDSNAPTGAAYYLLQGQ